MALDFGEVLTRAWKITWEHKILWVFSFIAMLTGLLFIPLGLAPAISIFLSEDVPIWINEPVYIFGYIGGFIILFIASYFIGSLVQAAISCGILRAERSDGNVTFNNVLKASFPFWGRFLGVSLMYSAGISLVIFAYYALQFLVSMLTFGLGALCLAPFQLLLYPFMLVAYAWYEQALASIVVDDLGVFESARRGWQVFRQHLLPVVLMALIMYLGIGMISAFASLPLMMPLFASFFAVMEILEGSRTIFIISALCATVYLPVLAVFHSIALTFMKSGWILTYLRLTRNPESGILVLPSA